MIRQEMIEVARRLRELAALRMQQCKSVGSDRSVSAEHCRSVLIAESGAYRGVAGAIELVLDDDTSRYEPADPGGADAVADAGKILGEVPNEKPVTPSPDRPAREADYMDIVFDRSPGSEPGRLLKIRVQRGDELNIGQWREGNRVLRLVLPIKYQVRCQNCLTRYWVESAFDVASCCKCGATGAGLHIDAATNDLLEVNQ